MTVARAKAFNDVLRRAKARLSDMQTQEVSIVDAAANLRRFVVVKRNSDMSDQKETAKVALRLPTEAKQGIMDSLGQALDKLTALATMVGEAEADDAAAVPADLTIALTQTGESIAAVGQQYAPVDPATQADPSNTPIAADASPEGKTVDPSAPATAPQLKALPPPQREGESLAPLKDSLTMKPKLAGLAGEMMLFLGEEVVEATKAGRKIAGSRYKKLSDLHNTLGTLLNELAYDEASEKAEEKAAKAPARKGDDAVAKNDAVAELLTLSKANADRIASAEAAISKMGRTTETPRAREVEGGGAPSSKTVWPPDMSAALAKKKAAR